MRRSRSRVPTVSEAVDLFIEGCRASRQKWLAGHISVLQGVSSGRQLGKAASGTALARSELGPLPLDRVGERHFTRWFNHRHPPHLRPATVKRGMSSLRTFLNYCHGQGWIGAEVLAAARSVPNSPPQRDYLHPEQVHALGAVLLRPRFDDYQRFGFDLMLTSGARPFEIPPLTGSSLDPRSSQLHISAGKGTGAGKPRDIPVDAEFVARWQAHVDRFDLGPADPVFFHRHHRFVAGSHRETAIEIDTSRSASQQSLRNLTAAVRDEAALMTRHGLLDRQLLPAFGLTPKVLRRTFACTQLVLNQLNLGGMEIVQLQEAMGHTSLDVTKLYLSDVHLYLGTVIEPVNTAEAASRIVAWKAARTLRDD